MILGVSVIFEACVGLKAQPQPVTQCAGRATPKPCQSVRVQSAFPYPIMLRPRTVGHLVPPAGRAAGLCTLFLHWHREWTDEWMDDDRPYEQRLKELVECSKSQKQQVHQAPTLCLSGG